MLVKELARDEAIAEAVSEQILGLSRLCVSPGRMSNPFRYFNSSPEVIRLVVMMYVRYPLSLRIVENLLAERGIDISHETVRFWWNRFGPMFAAEIRKKRVAHMRGFIQWRWHLDEVFVKATASCAICGERSTMRARSWKRWLPLSETKPRR